MTARCRGQSMKAGHNDFGPCVPLSPLLERLLVHGERQHVLEPAPQWRKQGAQLAGNRLQPRQVHDNKVQLKRVHRMARLQAVGGLRHLVRNTETRSRTTYAAIGISGISRTWDAQESGVPSRPAPGQHFRVRGWAWYAPSAKGSPPAARPWLHPAHEPRRSGPHRAAPAAGAVAARAPASAPAPRQSPRLQQNIA